MDVEVAARNWSTRNQRHVPVGRKIKLIMTTEDVIHDFFVPAFRTKADVVPGRYQTIWFEATKPGRYHSILR